MRKFIIKKICVLSALLLLVLPIIVSATPASWTLPTQYTDGSPLAATDISEVRIYCSQTSGGPYTLLQTVTPPAGATMPLGTDVVLASAGLWYCVGTVVDKNNLESAYSNEAIKIALTPGTLLNFTITVTVTGTIP